ncbi:hypothetical protein GCM10011594_42030 [Nakamurella endophytica]|uniref:Uncharacterized protein n=1 Tax=Nakamurella endophytica TaxID=1748367 RepID=A0A917TCA6_9ACTN|nr:hypothetical protein GCM10011594_42030 [Nakamurella endophytica]
MGGAAEVAPAVPDAVVGLAAELDAGPDAELDVVVAAEDEVAAPPGASVLHPPSATAPASKPASTIARRPPPRTHRPDILATSRSSWNAGHPVPSSGPSTGLTGTDHGSYGRAVTCQDLRG